MTEDDSLELDAIESENSPVAKLLAEKDAQIEAQKQSLLNSWSYCESLRKDAERYRWLQKSKRIYLGPVVGMRGGNNGERYILSCAAIGSAPYDVETLADAIDAAMMDRR